MLMKQTNNCGTLDQSLKEFGSEITLVIYLFNIWKD